MADRVLILGASARAAAASARRAGLDPFAIDLFADADTKQICDCLRCPPDRYPEGLFELARQAPPMPWMYTGGLENYPELIDALSTSRKLLGNGSRHFGNVRNPFILHAVLTAHGIAAPAVLPIGGPQPGNNPWVSKRYRSSGGQGISWYNYFDFSTPKKGDYIQQFVPGTSMSAVFVCMPWRVYLIATSRQLVGESWLHARPFAYCGNIGPCDLLDRTLEALKHIGFAVTQFGTKFGLVGVDFVLEKECPHPIEVNPRYPASVELLDLAYGEPMLKWHLECADALNPSDDDAEMREPTGFSRHSVIGKATYYAPYRITFPSSGPWDGSVRHAADVWRRPDFADVPHAGEVIEAGHPVLTILTEADTEAECLSRLQSWAAELDRLFGFPTPEGESCRP